LKRLSQVWMACLAVMLGTGPALGEEARTGNRTPPVNTFVSNVTFVVFDTETTGFSPTTDRIVEVGAVKFRNGEVLEEKSWLVNPQRDIPYWATKVHGITDEMVKGKPTFKEIYPEFQDFISGSVLMAHNAKFDISFVKTEVKRAGCELPPNLVIDSLSLFRKWYPKLTSHSVEAVARGADVKIETLHRAEADSLYVFLIFDKSVKERNDKFKLGDIYDQCGGPLKF
jgi:DNA polymerase III epsilon subunit family exonuclease